MQETDGGKRLTDRAEPERIYGMHAAPRSIVLMYHRIVATPTDPWGMCVAPSNFSGQLEAIRDAGRPMALVDYVRAQRQGDVPDRSIVLTFDDGYLDNYEQALPLLQRHEVPATLFVTTCNIDSGREFWWDQLETVLLAPDELPGRLQLQAPQGTLSWELGKASAYDDGQRLADRGVKAWQAEAGSRLAFYYLVWKTIWPWPVQRRDEAVAQVVAWAGHDPVPSTARRSMSSAEIRAMGQGGWMSIGAHSVDHLPLDVHPVDEQRRQIRESRRHLESIVGEEITTFAYPHGEYSPDTIRLLREEGFDCAVTVEHRLAFPGSDLMRLPRFGVKDITGDEFRQQLEHWFALAVGDGAAHVC